MNISPRVRSGISETLIIFRSGLLGGFGVVLVILGGGYWIATNAVNDECSNAVVQIVSRSSCFTVQTWHPVAGIAAILGGLCVPLAFWIARH